MTNHAHNIVLVLHAIRSTHNVGSLFRTADAMGVSHIHICEYTPAPIDRFGRVQKDIAKTALGAEEIVPWTQHTTTHDCIEALIRDGYTIAALEQHEHSVALDAYVPAGTPLALVLGAEVDGVAADILARCDVILEIPMRGTKESLNVSVAGGIALYALTSN